MVKGRGHEALGSVIRVRPESLEVYKKYHVAVWPEVLGMIQRRNIRNYSIYLRDDITLQIFKISRCGLRGGHGENGGASRDPGKVAVMMPWPICTHSANYQQRVEALQAITQGAGEVNRRKLFYDNAVRVYRSS